MERNPVPDCPSRIAGVKAVALTPLPTDDEVKALLGANDPLIHDVMLFCLLSGHAGGRGSRTAPEDLVQKGNLGLFVHVRPNAVRELQDEGVRAFHPVALGLGGHAELSSRRWAALFLTSPFLRSTKGFTTPEAAAPDGQGEAGVPQHPEVVHHPV